MKTTILFIAMLLLGGLVISSCQKDNSLVPDSESVAISKDVNGTPDDIVPHWEKDPITNYPDPFRDKTTIEITLQRSAQISLVVTNPNYGGITYLLKGYYRAGIYKCVFDATDMPGGEYIAHLRIDDIVVKERMIKREVQEKNKALAN
jgi:hypothetical protein